MLNRTFLFFLDDFVFVTDRSIHTDEVAQRQRAAAADEAYLQGLLQSGVMRACPSCHMPVERNGGCLHMSCRCGHHFWYAFGLLIYGDCEA